MPNWFESMQQTYEYYIVDPVTWKDIKKLDAVKSSSIDWDEDTDTLGSAVIDVTKTIGENYIRIYLVTIQNGVTEKFPLATVLVQTPSMSFDGKVENNSLDAYTPLIELKEKKPPIGYYVAENVNIMDVTCQITKDNLRAPVVKTTCTEELYSDFIADSESTWLINLKDLMANAKYKFALDEMGRILFSPKQDVASLQPVVTFDDGNSSILYPDIDMDRDLFGIPNVVEVVYSDGTDINTTTGKGGTYTARVVNDDPNSPTSTVSRGREILYRETNPSLIGNPTRQQIDEYAELLLQELSSVEYTITYTHGYYPVRVGDCVRLNYTRAGITDVKAKIVRQSIKCTPGCPVTETAVYTTRFWRKK